MPCYRPLNAWRSSVFNPKTRKFGITFSAKDAVRDLPLELPCGRCIGCRLEKSRQWAMRAVHEASLHDLNSFLTLTYSPEYLPSNGSIVPKHMVDFVKRLRKRVDVPLRTFGCAEYGERGGRPHYHLCVFGWYPSDAAILKSTPAGNLYRSPLLEETWTFGHSSVGELNFETAAYVARYVTKKLSGERASEYGDRLPERSICVSRRPGLGRDWIDLYRSEVYPSDRVVIRGREMRPPNYYDRVFEPDFPEAFESVRKERVRCGKEAARKALLERPDPFRGIDRRYIKEFVAEARFKLLRRSYENET